MSIKSGLGKTEKYQGMAKTVRETANKPEEPRITPEQVDAAFRSFGFVPNERGHNDIGYWTTRGQSEGAKLMEELRKRRIEENKKTDSQAAEHESIQKTINDSKRTLPRLNDDEITALYDEYGLPVPDPAWVRENLPNDPKKIRAILETQRKTADDMEKKQAKNAVNSIQSTPQNVAMPQKQQQPMMGMGGPTPAMPDMLGGSEGEAVTPFFVGDHALVKITNPNNPNAGTLWLADSKKKVLRPISSMKIIENAFEDPQAAIESITTVSSRALAPGGALEGFTPLNQDKALKDDGSMDNIDFSPAQLKTPYGGVEADPQEHQRALSALDGLFGKIKSQGGVSGQNPDITQNTNNIG